MSWKWCWCLEKDDKESRSGTALALDDVESTQESNGVIHLPNGRDTICNFGLEFTSILDRGHAAWELCSGSIGFGRQAMDCLHNKGSKATASEHCETRTHDDIVGRQYRLLRWMVFD